jgi:hypothetical protein
MTSMADLLRRPVPMAEVRARVAERLAEQFQLTPLLPVVR